MHVRICKFAPSIVVVLSLCAAACEERSAAIGPRLTGPSPFQSRLVSVEPAAIAPEFLTSASCRTFPPFRTRFNLFLRADREFFLRELRFDFRDRFGVHTLPNPVPTSTTATTIPTTIPVPLPASLPVPLPGTLSLHDARVLPPFGALGLVLNFDCGVRADGTLFIDVETADAEGGIDVARVSVRIE